MLPTWQKGVIIYVNQTYESRIKYNINIFCEHSQKSAEIVKSEDSITHHDTALEVLY